jgi:hypothetical protein
VGLTKRRFGRVIKKIFAEILERLKEVGLKFGLRILEKVYIYSINSI